MTTNTRLRRARSAEAVGPHDWPSWCAHLERREQPADPWGPRPANSPSPLAWGLPCDDGPAATDWIDQLCRPSKRSASHAKRRIAELESWLSRADARGGDRELTLESLAWLHALPGLARWLPAAPWCDVLDHLLRAAGRPRGKVRTEDDLAVQLSTVELPLTLAYWFPEIESCRQQLQPGCQGLIDSLTAHLDGNGMPRAELLGAVRPLLACWVRCLTLAKKLGAEPLAEPIQNRLSSFVRQCLALSRDDGSSLLDGPAARRTTAPLFETALSLVGGEDDFAIADQVLPWRRARRASSQRTVFFPPAAAETEWGRTAILRPNWLRGGARLLIAWHRPHLVTELVLGDRPLWSGDWTCRVRIDGEQLEPEGEWQPLCWHSDDDVDYLELELPLSDRWTLQRQVVLAREDGFLFAADAVIGAETAAIEYESCLPLSDGVSFEAQRETREGCLLDRRCLARVLPLSLPEWRAAETDGTLVADDRGLRMVRHRSTSRLYAPLLIDLHRARHTCPVTWRQLTVGRSLSIEPPTEAVGYRVQIGGEQWLFYRSLSSAANRTVLGKNLLNEFYAGRFSKDGETEDLIAIDAADA